MPVSFPQESGGWQLEAGALVLSDGGVCCIGEVQCMYVRTYIHMYVYSEILTLIKGLFIQSTYVQWECQFCITYVLLSAHCRITHVIPVLE